MITLCLSTCPKPLPAYSHRVTGYMCVLSVKEFSGMASRPIATRRSSGKVEKHSLSVQFFPWNMLYWHSNVGRVSCCSEANCLSWLVSPIWSARTISISARFERYQAMQISGALSSSMGKVLPVPTVMCLPSASLPNDLSASAPLQLFHHRNDFSFF